MKPLLFIDPVCLFTSDKSDLEDKFPTNYYSLSGARTSYYFSNGLFNYLTSECDYEIHFVNTQFFHMPYLDLISSTNTFVVHENCGFMEISDVIYEEVKDNNIGFILILKYIEEKLIDMLDTFRDGNNSIPCMGIQTDYGKGLIEEDLLMISKFRTNYKAWETMQDLTTSTAG